MNRGAQSALPQLITEFIGATEIDSEDMVYRDIVLL